MSFYDPMSSGADEFALPKPQKPSTAWMLTVADLFSLMLTFFVLLYSMSEIKHDKWEEINNSLASRLKLPVKQDAKSAVPEFLSIDRINVRYARGLDYLTTVVEKQLATNSEEFNGLEVVRLSDRIILSLASDQMFLPASAQLSPDGKYRVKQLGHFLSSIGNAVTVEGHSDPIPIHNESYESNWELSMARAITVANTLYESGYPHILSIYGLGSSRYNQPLEPGKPEERSKHFKEARRVDIVIRETVAK